MKQAIILTIELEYKQKLNKYCQIFNIFTLEEEDHIGVLKQNKY